MDNKNLTDVLAYASVLAVFVLALVQLVKKNITMPKNLIPFVGLFIGLLIGAVSYKFTELDLVLRL